MKATFTPVPRDFHPGESTTLTDLLQQPDIAREQERAKNKLRLTAEDLQRQSRELVNIDSVAEANARRKKTALIKQLEEECARDKAALSRTSPIGTRPSDATIPRFETARILVKRLDLPPDALLKHLEENFRNFLQGPVNTQWKQDVLLDATIKTREEWKADVLSVFTHLASAGGKTAAPHDASLGNKIDALVRQFEKMLIESGPYRFSGETNETLHLEGKTFVKDKHMGRGCNGAVARYINADTGESVAVKTPLFATGSTEQRVKFNEQIRLHRLAMGPHADNPSVIPLKGAIVDSRGVPHALMAEATGGDCRNLRQTLKYLVAIGLLPFAAKEAIERSLFVQAVRGIDTLHELGLVHSDMKWANIFLEQNGQAKLGDFDLSKLAASPQQSLYIQAKTWAAKSALWKDLVQDNPYTLLPKDDDPKKDIFSLYYMLPDAAPFSAAGRLKHKTQGEEKTSLLIPNIKGVQASAYANQADVDQAQIDALVQTVIQFQQNLSPDERKAVDEYGYMPENDVHVSHMHAVRAKADTLGFTSRLKEFSRPFAA